MRFLFRLFIKLLLITGIIFFALWNYRIFSFYKGFSKSEVNNYTVSEAVVMLNNIEKIEYYEKIVKSDESKYKVYIITSEDAYLMNASQDDIENIKSLSIFSEDVKPQKFTPIPFYVEIIVGLIILVIPFGRLKKKEA